MSSRKTIIVDARETGWGNLFKDLHEYRDLFWVFAYRDFRVRYAQTMIGILWAVIQPMVTLGIFIIVFQYAVKVDTGSIPYPLMSFVGLGAWSYFAFILREAGSSMINSSHIIKKIYFPRIFLPASKVATALVEWAMVWLFTVMMFFYYGCFPPIQILLFPLFVLAATMASLGAGFWMSGLTIKFRDFQHIIPFLTQIGIYLSPVAYPSGLIPKEYRFFYYLNPMAGIIDGLRWCMIDTSFSPYIWISLTTALALFMTGFYYFCFVERKMADFL